MPRRSLFLRAAPVAVVCVLLGPGDPAGAQEPPVFEDRAAELGLDFVHWNGMTGEYYFPEMTGQGCAFLDYDGDGDLDVYLVEGALLAGNTMDEALVPYGHEGPPRGRLFRNDARPGPDGILVPRFVDVTDQSGLLATGYGMGVATGDYDGDGRVDLYLTNYGPNQLWRNRGDGSFEDVTARTGVGTDGWSSSASFLDYDRDGRLDLYVVNYLDFDVAKNPSCYTGGGRRDYCGPADFPPVTDRLYRNRGPHPEGPDGVTFEDVSGPSGIAAAKGPGLGVVAADFDGDGWTDLFVANDGAVNFLWRNRGRGEDGAVHFSDEALLSGVALNRAGQAEASMGVDAGDFDADGDLDLFMTHLAGETNTLYVNDGTGLFEDRTLETGLGAPSFPLTSFGTAWLDYDNDGWLDLFAASGAVRILEEQARAGDPHPLKQPKQLFRGVAREGGGRRFEDVTAASGDILSLPEVSRGLAVGDVDADGDPDVLLANNAGPVRLLIDGVGQARPWVALDVIGASGAPAVGAMVTVERDGGVALVRRVRTDGSYASAHAPRVLVGLGEASRISGVGVRRGDGSETVWRGIEPGRAWTLYPDESDDPRGETDASEEAR
jgi:enediyne biosynthesis protein E4